MKTEGFTWDWGQSGETWEEWDLETWATYATDVDYYAWADSQKSLQKITAEPSAKTKADKRRKIDSIDTTGSKRKSTRNDTGMGSSTDKPKSKRRTAQTQKSGGSQVIKTNQKRKQTNQKRKQTDKETDQAKTKTADKATTTKKKKTTKVMEEAPQVPVKREALFNLLFAAGKRFVKSPDYKQAEEEIKEPLRKIKTRFCRLNIYWTRTAVGVHSKEEQCDFAYYRLPTVKMNWSVQMAVVVKIGELLAL